MSSERPLLRSLLFVPGTRTEWLAKAEAAGADAVILDLEDAVPADGKAQARRDVAAAMAGYAGHLALLVRVNPLDGWAGAEELRAVAHERLTGVVLPKVSGPEDVRLADRLLAWCERERGLPRGHIALVPLLETASGLRGAYDVAMAAPSRIAYLGAVTAPGGDVARAVGYRWTPDSTLGLRSRVLLDVRAAGIPNPVAGLWTGIGDLDGLRSFAGQNRSLGYEGMMAIHPSHVPVINAAFSPSPDELARYARLIAAVEAAQAGGSGAVTFEGEMVDEAMAATARAVLDRYGR
ncbi:HpcH/HpaI aldolase/citrate lyase family protein [Nonomuraea angiospora]|uniref:Citrate lyase subunit beta/citryl-CoA lyase n=1 Tax=Nonomuraea angiospora TaxID=46172 RepID=A0ABR9MDB6_9ACTN|nr:CoA ester lyase [Nonomuraea angiospora]MBE1590915.1 citrate lyase subunit beta/citryl-CoA lyase [Nonomuraea angiospora]